MWRMQDIAQSLAANDHPSGKVRQHDEAKDNVEPFYQVVSWQKRRGDDEYDGNQIENKSP